MNLHSRVAFLPFVPYTRKVLISKGFQGDPQTVGQHILRKRLEVGLTQRQLGERLGVDMYSVSNWEKGKTKTFPAKVMPAVIGFLGYNPEPKPEEVGAQLRWKRRSLGWTTAEAARRNSVDQSTWEAWENREDWPNYPRFRNFLQEFLIAPAIQLQGQVRKVASATPRRGQTNANGLAKRI